MNNHQHNVSVNVNSTGKIMSVNILNPGTGYTTSPQYNIFKEKIYDKCIWLSENNKINIDLQYHNDDKNILLNLISYDENLLNENPSLMEAYVNYNNALVEELTKIKPKLQELWDTYKIIKNMVED